MTIAEPGYWEQSRGPLASLIFVSPLLAIYELGVIVLGPYAVRNGADAWLRGLLDLVGFGQYFLLPVLVVALLLAWHHTSGRAWQRPRGIYAAMAVECLFLAVCLRVVLHVQGIAVQHLGLPVMEVRGSLGGAMWQTGAAVGFLGAGIYEELLFRLMLLPAIVAGLRAAGLQRVAAVVIGVVVASIVFSAAHHVGAYGESFQWFRFLFRFVAGVFFSALFLHRGFGIVAGSHAGYDILVGLM